MCNCDTSTDTDDFSPIVQGDTGADFAPQFLRSDGTPRDLTGATISMVMRSSDGFVVKAGAGTWVIDDATNGKTHYLYDANDVAVADEWTLYITITIGGKPVHAGTKKLLIEPLPVVTA